MCFKKSLKYLNDIFYQMDNIWYAPSSLKKSPGLLIWEQYAISLCQLLWKTLYVIIAIIPVIGLGFQSIIPTIFLDN